MKIEMSQSSMTAQFLYASSSQAAAPSQGAPRSEHDHGRRHRVAADDQVSWSNAAQQTRQVRDKSRDHEDNPLSALDKLTSQLIKTMMHALTGRDFKMLSPSQAGGATTPAASVSPPATAVPAAPVTTPATDTAPAATTEPPAASTPNVPAGPFSGAVAAYYQVQSFSLSYSASGTVNTEDGKEVGISVHFSFSQQSYAFAGLFAGGVNPTEASGSSQPLKADFQGVAAQLTQTSFNFEVDFNGQPGSVVAPQTPEPTVPASTPSSAGTAPAAPATTPANAAAAAPTDQAVAGKDQSDLLEQLDKLFEKLQVWLRHPGGDRQLIAVGLNSSSAVYVGNLNVPAAAAPVSGSAPTEAADTAAKPEQPAPVDMVA